MSLKRAAWGSVATFVVALCYFLIFRTYGFLVEDEGTLLFQLDRVVRGQSPYLDFHTGYTPGFFAAGAWLLETVGYSLVGLRVALALINAGVAAALYAIARRVAAPWTAAVAPALWVAFIPVYRGQFAAFNVPYPAWFATAAWMAVAAAMLAWSRRGGHALLVAAGAAAAATFSVKLNGGAYALAGCTWIVATMTRGERAWDRAVTTAAVLFMGLGIWFAFDFSTAAEELAVHLLACSLLIALAVGPHAHRFASAAHPRASTALSALALGFVVPTMLWAWPLIARLGAESFAREVLLIGSGAAELYYSDHPRPQLYALALTVALAAAVLGGRLVVARRMRPLPWLTAAIVATAAALPMALRGALMPEGALESLDSQLQNSAFWVAPLANLSAVAMLAALARRRAHDSTLRSLAVIVPLAVAMYLQLYPRADFMHVIMAVPLTAVAGSAVLERVAGWWAAGRWPRAWSGPRCVGVAVAASLVVVVGVRLAITVAAPLGTRSAAVDGAPRLGVTSVEAAAADDLEALRRTAAYLAQRTEPGEPVLAFPALAGILFVAARSSPVPHDYWFPGRPSHDDEARMLARLAADPPRYVVALNDGWTFFAGAPAYFASTRRFVREHYRLAARIGRFDVLARNDVATQAPPLRWQPSGPRRDAVEPHMAARRQAAVRWMAGLRPRDVEPDRLPDDPRSAVLLLRALRDGGDLRAAGLVVAGESHADSRVRNEARGAMKQLTENFWAAVDRWGGDLAFDDYRSFVGAYVEDARRLSADADARVASFAATILWVADDEAWRGNGMRQDGDAS